WLNAISQLTIYSGFNLQGTSATCPPKIVITENAIPNGLNNKIRSIVLDSGYMATLAENADGTGERFTYMATKSAIRVNLSMQLQDNISFIRVLKLHPVKIKKKGVCSTNNKEIDSIGNTTWFYDWNDRDISTPTREYAPMAFMWYSTRDTSIAKVISKDSISHYIAYNEPDVTGPSRQFVSTAIPAYKNMLKAGLRMGSPSASYLIWQDTFARQAKAQKLRIDYVCLHWYDWGAYMTTHPDSVVSAQGILTRMKAFLNAVYDYYRKPIWLTEFNANINRTDSVHHEFMKIALPWLDSCHFVERYSYFFGKDIASINANGSLTTAGKIYANHNSVDAYPENIIDTRPAFPTSLVSWQASAIAQGGFNQTTFAPTRVNSNFSVPLPLTRGQGLVLPPSNSSNGYWGASSFSTTTAEDAITDRKFFSFSLKSTNGKTVNYHSISKINLRIGATGPIKYLLDYTVDNGRTFIIDSISGPTRVTGNYVLDSIDLAGISNLQNISPNSTVTFRIIPYDASGTGVFLIGSGVNDTLPDLEINGAYSEANLVTTTLPVKLVNFQLENKAGTSFLNWTITSAINFSHFELQRSYNGIAFETIAAVEGKNQQSSSNYSYIDKPSTFNIVYYRLKIVDKDGSFSYSNILKAVSNDNQPSFNVFPSIIKGEMLTVDYSNFDTPSELSVINLNAQIVKAFKVKANNGIIKIETNNLNKGMYIVQLKGKNVVLHKKIIIL
ncbi:MAG: glycosyl hydrolase, partial [Chitinophagaceae bacterium]